MSGIYTETAITQISLVPQLEPEAALTFRDRVCQLRAIGDAEGVAQLLLSEATSPEERQAFLPTQSESQVLSRLKKERHASRKHLEALSELNGLRSGGNLYRLAFLVTRRDSLHRDLVFGSSLPAGVPRFELTSPEAEAVRLRELGLTKDDEPIKWEMFRRGSYHSTNGRWSITRVGFNKWGLYLDDRQVGGFSWRKHGGVSYWPFTLLDAAKEWAEECQRQGKHELTDNSKSWDLIELD